MTSTRLAIVFDARSAATPTEICTGLAGLARPLFVVPSAGPVRELRGLLEQLGDVVEISDSSAATAREVRPFFPDGILTFNETLLPFTAALAEELDLPFHSRETTSLAVDKFRQRERLRAAGVDAVRSAVITGPGDVPAALERVGAPAIVKPASGGGSRDVHLVHSVAEAVELVGRLPASPAEPFVVEEYLVGRDLAPFGDYLSVETAVSYGHASHIAITGKGPLVPPFRETAQFWPALLDPDEQTEVLRLTTDIVAALGVRTGMVHTEFKRTATGPRLIEFNGRMGGFMQDMSAHTGGPDLIATAARIALGERVSLPLLDTDRVAFQAWNLAPIAPSRLERVDGAAEVRGQSDVVSYHTYVRPGTDLGGGVMVHRLDLLSGVSAHHERMFTAMDEALSALSFTFAFAHGRSTVTGRQLVDMPENRMAPLTRGGASTPRPPQPR